MAETEASTARADTALEAEGHGFGALVSEWRHNWRPGLAATIGIAIGTSVFPSLSSLFVQPLQDTFGWTRGQIALAQNASLVSAVVAPFIGRVIDRVGVRPVLMSGIILMASFHLGLAAMSGPIWVFYILFAGLHGTGVLTSGLSYSRVVSAHFVKSRGLSLAISRTGLAASSALLPVIVFGIITDASWRYAFVFLAALLLFISLPLAFFWIKPQPKPTTQAAPQERLSWRAALTNPKVILVCLAAGLAYAPIIAILSQLHPILVGKGIEPATAAGQLGMLGFASIIGALVTGALVDRIWAPAVAAVSIAGAIVGCLLLLSPEINNATALAAVLLVGLGLGAELDVGVYVVARYFGVARFSTIYGMLIFVISTLSATLGSLIGYSYDRFGNYEVALVTAACVLTASALCYLSLGRYPPREA